MLKKYLRFVLVMMLLATVVFSVNPVLASDSEPVTPTIIKTNQQADCVTEIVDYTRTENGVMLEVGQSIEIQGRWGQILSIMEREWVSTTLFYDIWRYHLEVQFCNGDLDFGWLPHECAVDLVFHNHQDFGDTEYWIDHDFGQNFTFYPNNMWLYQAWDITRIGMLEWRVVLDHRIYTMTCRANIYAPLDAHGIPQGWRAQVNASAIPMVTYDVVWDEGDQWYEAHFTNPSGDRNFYIRDHGWWWIDLGPLDAAGNIVPAYQFYTWLQPQMSFRFTFDVDAAGGPQVTIWRYFGTDIDRQREPDQVEVLPLVATQ